MMTVGASEVLADQLMEHGATFAETMRALNAALPGHVVLGPEEVAAIREMLIRYAQDEDSDAVRINAEIHTRAVIAARRAGIMDTPKRD